MLGDAWKVVFPARGCRARKMPFAGRGLGGRGEASVPLWREPGRRLCHFVSETGQFYPGRAFYPERSSSTFRPSAATASSGDSRPPKRAAAYLSVRLSKAPPPREKGPPWRRRAAYSWGVSFGRRGQPS